MNLQHLREETCSHCKAETTAMEQNNRHCNGHWNESRTYRCGHKLTFSPNYMAIKVSNECPRTEKTKAQIAARVNALESTKHHIASLDCDDLFKKRLARDLLYIDPKNLY